MYNIFLVEDDETIAKMVKNHLEKWDYEVRIAQKFDRIMAEFADYEPQLVLMGYRVCRFIMATTGVHRYGKYQMYRSYFLSSAGRQYEYCDGSYNGGG